MKKAKKLSLRYYHYMNKQNLDNLLLIQTTRNIHKYKQKIITSAWSKDWKKI